MTPDPALPFVRRPGAARRVLVVDDAALVRLFYREALETAGFGVEEAINGIEAMEKALSQRFDLMIVDVNMPKMDGLALLRTLRAQAEIATIPVLVTSSEAAGHDVAAAREAGANHYLVKPISQEDLVLYSSVLTGTPA
jgi:two-component system chemotaxis response regulator CheY